MFMVNVRTLHSPLGLAPVLKVEELCLVRPHVEEVVSVVRGDVDGVAPGSHEL